jgi:hypothetical protein
MEEMRSAIIEETFPKFKESFLATYQSIDDEIRIVQKQKWLQAQREKAASNNLG